VKVGQTWSGITVLGRQRQATSEIEGKRRCSDRPALPPRRRPRATAQVTLAADAAATSSREARSTASRCASSSTPAPPRSRCRRAEAQRLGIDFRKGERGLTHTANGVVPSTACARPSARRASSSSGRRVVIEQGLDIALSA
jgi:hypothetical protein